MPGKDKTFVQKKVFGNCWGEIRENVCYNAPQEPFKTCLLRLTTTVQFAGRMKIPNSCDIEEEEQFLHAWGKSSDYLTILYIF